MSDHERFYRAYLAAREARDLRRRLLPVVRGPSLAAGHLRVAGKTYVDFAGNDYLALSRHPALIARARVFARKYGVGAGASRLVTGHGEVFAAIEDKLARFKGKPAALIFPSGFQANATVLHALLDARVLGAPPLVFFDRLNHASMHFGCWAARVKPIRYEHCDLTHLEALLKAHADNPAPRFILSESIFSMDGDLAPLAGLSRLARRYDAMLVIDDAHGTGIAGPAGAGLAAQADADVVIGTFSKAMGSLGAYVACSQTLRDYLINRCTGFVYSTALAPPIWGAVDAALDLVPQMEAERAHVRALAAHFRQAMRAAGFDTGHSCTQIVPIITGGAREALETAARLREAGFWCTPIRPPTVPDGQARLRFTFCAAHSQAQVEALGDILARHAPQARP